MKGRPGGTGSDCVVKINWCIRRMPRSMVIIVGGGCIQGSGGDPAPESQLKQHLMSSSPPEGRFPRSASMCVFLLLALLVGSVAPVSAQEKDAAQEQYYVASAAYNRKLYPVAVTQFGEFLQKNPKHAKADLASDVLQNAILRAFQHFDRYYPAATLRVREGFYLISVGAQQATQARR